MANSFKTHLIYILIIVIAIVGIVYLYNKTQSIKQEKAQIYARLNDSLTVYKDGNLELYRRVAGLEDLNVDLNSILKERNEKITSQSKLIIRLKDQISSGTGHLDTLIILDPNCKGLTLTYSTSNALSSLFVKAIVDDPPRFETKQTYNPFGALARLTRNKEGIYSGYLEIFPDSIKEFITIEDFDIQIDLDEYQGNPCDIIALKLAPSVSFGLNKDIKGLISIGGQALIKETHLIGYEKGINNDYHWIRYSYFPDFLSF